MKIIEEQVEIKAKLLAQDQAWDMLDILPQKHSEVPFLLREYVFEFRVVVQGFAQTIIVSRNSFAIILYLEPVMETVKYYVEEEKPDKLTSIEDGEKLIATI